MLWRSVDDWEVRQALPQTVAALARLGRQGPAGRKGLRGAGKRHPGGARLRHHRHRGQAAQLRTERLPHHPDQHSPQSEGGAGARHGQGDAGQDQSRPGANAPPGATIKDASGPVTSFYLLAALDLTRNVDGAIVAAAPDQAIYRDVFARTFTHQPRRHGALPDPWLPGRLPAGDAAAGPIESADDLRLAAVLDFASGPHLRLDRAVAEQRRRERQPALAWHHRRAVAPDLQPLRCLCGHDPRSACRS